MRSSKVLASMGSWAGNGKPEVRPPGWQIAPDINGLCSSNGMVSRLSANLTLGLLQDRPSFEPMAKTVFHQQAVATEKPTFRY